MHAKHKWDLQIFCADNLGKFLVGSSKFLSRTREDERIVALCVRLERTLLAEYKTWPTLSCWLNLQATMFDGQWFILTLDLSMQFRTIEGDVKIAYWMQQLDDTLLDSIESDSFA